jgi:nicotinate-nucleotide adenylyltransferase
VDRELRRPGPSFTVATLEEYAREQPGRELWFVLGADNLRLLPTWHRHHRLLELARIATFPRLGTTIDDGLLLGLDLTAGERAALLQGVLRLEPDAVASDDLRARLQAGERGLPELLPAVEAYVLAHHLYGT